MLIVVVAPRGNVFVVVIIVIAVVITISSSIKDAISTSRCHVSTRCRRLEGCNWQKRIRWRILRALRKLRRLPGRNCWHWR
jgi:hypothetical protein